MDFRSAPELPSTPAPVRGPIRPSVRREILADRTCHYCGAAWAGVIDHVMPVKHGGSSARGNLVAACNRCNSEKSARTPAQWRTAREAAGLTWPPLNCERLLAQLLLLHADEDDRATVAEALQAGYRPLLDAVSALHDAHFSEQYPEDGDDSDVEGIVELAHAWRAQVAV